MSLEFTTAAKRRDPITFTLDGTEFTFQPAKTARVILGFIDDEEGAGATALFDWLGTGLGEDQEKVLFDRLRDDNDDFDTNDLMEIAKDLLGAVSGRPLE